MNPHAIPVHWRDLLRHITFFLLSLILVASMALFAGLNASSDTIYRELEFVELEGTVKVYRDDLGVPTIVGDTLHDLVFIQGYEFARDRSFQLEFYRSLINGELSKIFGEAFVDTDKFLRTVGLKRVAEGNLEQLSAEERSLSQAYVNGINKFYTLHQHNAPVELEIFGIKPTPWKVADSIAMGSIVVQLHSRGGK